MILPNFCRLVYTAKPNRVEQRTGREILLALPFFPVTGNPVFITEFPIVFPVLPYLALKWIHEIWKILLSVFTNIEWNIVNFESW